jgi:hypothetical protein
MSMLVCIKRLGANEVGNVVNGVRLQEERAEQGAFGVEALGRDAHC